MLLESGPATGDRNRFLIIFLMTFLFGLYFIYDGVWGYVADNRTEAVKILTSSLGLDKEALPAEFGPTPTKPEADALIATPPEDVEALTEQFGSALHVKPGTGGETYYYFVSDYGMLETKVRFGKLLPGGLTWTKWSHTKEEIDYQIYVWGALCFVVAAYALVRILLLMRLRVTIDENGLDYGGRRIAFAEMRGFDNFSAKGWVDLVYETGDAEKHLRLDNYRIDRYDEVLDTLVRHANLSDPRPQTSPQSEPADDDTSDNP